MPHNNIFGWTYQRRNDRARSRVSGQLTPNQYLYSNSYTDHMVWVQVYSDFFRRFKKEACANASFQSVSRLILNFSNFYWGSFFWSSLWSTNHSPQLSQLSLYPWGPFAQQNPQWHKKIFGGSIWQQTSSLQWCTSAIIAKAKQATQHGFHTCKSDHKLAHTEPSRVSKWLDWHCSWSMLQSGSCQSRTWWQALI